MSRSRRRRAGRVWAFVFGALFTPSSYLGKCIPHNEPERASDRAVCKNRFFEEGSRRRRRLWRRRRRRRQHRGVHFVVDSFHCSGNPQAGWRAGRGRSAQRKSNTGERTNERTNGRSNAAAASAAPSLSFHAFLPKPFTYGIISSSLGFIAALEVETLSLSLPA